MTEVAWRAWRVDLERQLRAGRIASAEHEARWLCEHISGHAGPAWTDIERVAPSARQIAALEQSVQRRLAGEPLQYILGEWPFRDLDLLVDARVLIPRPETEWVVEIALRRAPDHARRAVDLGTGSGAIALALARARPHWHVVATDVSAAALAVARLNGAGNGLTNVDFRSGDWFDALDDDWPGTIDVLVTNPPYVAEYERDGLAREVVDHEPALALFAGHDGLDAIRAILGAARKWVRPGGVVVIEHGATQGDDVVGLATEHGLVDAATEPDLAGRPRMLVARRP